MEPCKERTDVSGSGLDRLQTEQANPRTCDLDLLPTEEMLRVINAEDRRVAEAVAEVIPAIARAVERIADAVRAGGRLHYFGAGTSGRLAVLDASECPPTFGVPAEMVQGHIAGGPPALVRSAEGAEDDEASGARDAAGAGIGVSDAVVAIAASGRTPYCIGALREARRRQAFTAALVCNRPTPMHELADVVIDPVVGPEVLSGSTRMKSGTAQKLVLNMISTGLMVRLGRTHGNLMVAVRATNEKLRARAARLVAQVTGRTEGVEEALLACGWDVRTACLMLIKDIPAEDAHRLLEEASGSLRAALEG